MFCDSKWESFIDYLIKNKIEVTITNPRYHWETRWLFWEVPVWTTKKYKGYITYRTARHHSGLTILVGGERFWSQRTGELFLRGGKKVLLQHIGDIKIEVNEDV